MDRFSTFVCAGAIALVAVFAGATCAQAQMMRGNFDDADANHDGRVTLQEFEAYATGRLMAANGPMVISIAAIGMGHNLRPHPMALVLSVGKLVNDTRKDLFPERPRSE
jgi:hypothetical protein